MKAPQSNRTMMETAKRTGTVVQMALPTRSAALTVTPLTHRRVHAYNRAAWINVRQNINRVSYNMGIKPRAKPEVFNTSLGTMRMLMNEKSCLIIIIA